MGPALGPAAVLQPLLKMAPAPLQRGGHAKTALGSLPPDSGSMGWRAELHQGESRHRGRDAAPLGRGHCGKGMWPCRKGTMPHSQAQLHDSAVALLRAGDNGPQVQEDEASPTSQACPFTGRVPTCPPYKMAPTWGSALRGNGPCLTASTAQTEHRAGFGATTTTTKCTKKKKPNKT